MFYHVQDGGWHILLLQHQLNKREKGNTEKVNKLTVNKSRFLTRLTDLCMSLSIQQLPQRCSLKGGRGEIRCDGGLVIRPFHSDVTVGHCNQPVSRPHDPTGLAETLSSKSEPDDRIAAVHRLAPSLCRMSNTAIPNCMVLALFLVLFIFQLEML